MFYQTHSLVVRLAHPPLQAKPCALLWARATGLGPFISKGLLFHAIGFPVIVRGRNCAAVDEGWDDLKGHGRAIALLVNPSRLAV
jgi:hypothetical protein